MGFELEISHIPYKELENLLSIMNISLLAVEIAAWI